MRSLQQGSDNARIAGLLALGALGLHLACGGNYGWFRDEMYFLACGRRLAWGYVDQPPLIALVSRLSYALSGGHVWLYRLPAALSHAADPARACHRCADRPAARALAGAQRLSHVRAARRAEVEKRAVDALRLPRRTGAGDEPARAPGRARRPVAGLARAAAGRHRVRP